MWRPSSANCIRQLCSPASSPWNFEGSGGGPEKDSGPTGVRKAIKECRARPGRQRWLVIPSSHRNANFALVKVGFGALSIVRTPLRNVGHPHPLRTSAIVMHTRMDGIASAGIERDLRVHSVAPSSSARYLDRRVVEACPFGEIRSEICGDQSRDCLPG